MKKNWMILSLAAISSLLYLLVYTIVSVGPAAASLNESNHDEAAFLPVILVPEIPTDPDAINGSFEDGWTDIDSRSQLPNAWNLYRIPEGEPLFDSEDLATGTCECKHLLNRQLPLDQQIGGPDALILDGLTVYKLFTQAKWGSELSQTWVGMTPGSTWRLTVPVRVHLHEWTDEWAAESSLWVNDVGYWANGVQMGDQNWCKHEQVFDVPANGKVEIAIRVKSKWAEVRDFFIDDIVLQPASEPAPHQDMDWCRENPDPIRYQPVQPRR